MPLRGAEEEEELVVEVEEEQQWKIGDVCECEDTLGASMVALGMPEFPGKLVPKPPGMYWRVKIDQVEHVWPGFTEENFPLVVCKVSYIGCGTEKHQEWVQASRLRYLALFPWNRKFAPPQHSSTLCIPDARECLRLQELSLWSKIFGHLVTSSSLRWLSP